MDANQVANPSIKTVKLQAVSNGKCLLLMCDGVLSHMFVSPLVELDIPYQNIALTGTNVLWLQKHTRILLIEFLHQICSKMYYVSRISG